MSISLLTNLNALTALENLRTNGEFQSRTIQRLSSGYRINKAADDALHIAVAATKTIPYLLTWNCRHLANAVMRPVIETVCKAKGFKAPIICTPEELLGSKP